MATITVRDLDEGLKQRLRLRAAHHSRSMEEEVRQILQAALSDTPTPGNDMAQRIRARFSDLGDVVLPATPREAVRAAPGVDALVAPKHPTPARRRAR